MLHPLHWTERAPVSELGLRLCVGFALSQLLVWLVLAPLVPRVCALVSAHKEAHAASDGAGLRARFDQVLCAQREALQHTFSLAASGARQRGHEAEEKLGRARQTVESLLARPRLEPNVAALESVTFSLLQLQNALDHLLQQTEMLVDAQVAGLGDERSEPGRAFESEPLAELHRLLAEGLEAARASLCAGEPLDIDAARAREIQMNRIEAAARGALLTATPRRALQESRLRVLQVVDAYEASGNQAYRLAELLSS
jgi:hypothetical protein